jgi:hypothetical protein
VNHPDMRDGIVRHCPSAAADSPNARVLGVVIGTPVSPHVAYLPRPVPFTESMKSLLGGLHPGEVFRLTSPCVEKRCHFFSGHHCRLGERIARTQVPDALAVSPCSIRARCRWFAEQGSAVCHGCSQVVTELPTGPADASRPQKPGHRHLPIVPTRSAIIADHEPGRTDHEKSKPQ